MSDATKIYHYESLNKYIKQSHFSKIEVGNQIYDNQKDIEFAVNNILEKSMSNSHSVDRSSFEKLFSFEVPKVSNKDNEILTQNVTRSELRKALKKLRSKAKKLRFPLSSGKFT